MYKLAILSILLFGAACGHKQPAPAAGDHDDDDDDRAARATHE